MKQQTGRQARAVVVISGGLDSSTVAYIAQKELGYEIYPLTFLYGQRHIIEIICANKIVASLGATERHRFISLPHPTGTALVTNNNIEIPTDRNLEQISEKIPISYVPARNTLFIAFALQYAEEVGADAIFTGVNAMDASPYPDTRPEYIRAWQNLINLATAKTVNGSEIVLASPILQSYKAEIIEWGTSLGVPYEHTFTCYNPIEGKPCGRCDSCSIRLSGWLGAGLTDPLIYASRIKEEDQLHFSGPQAQIFILNNGERRGRILLRETDSVSVVWDDGAVTVEKVDLFVKE